MKAKSIIDFIGILIILAITVIAIIHYDNYQINHTNWHQKPYIIAKNAHFQKNNDTTDTITNNTPPYTLTITTNQNEILTLVGHETPRIQHNQTKIKIDKNHYFYTQSAYKRYLKQEVISHYAISKNTKEYELLDLRTVLQNTQ